MYRGVAWLCYDEQFRQQKAVRPSLHWDHKHISWWMRLMAAPRGGSQPFLGMAGTPHLGGPRQAPFRKGNGKGRDAAEKRGDSSEGGRDAPVSCPLPK